LRRIGYIHIGRKSVIQRRRAELGLSSSCLLRYTCRCCSVDRFRKASLLAWAASFI